MGNTKYKAGDIVRIKSKEWYDEHKNKFGKVWTKSLSGEYNVCFDQDFVKYCGREAEIFSVEPENYTLKGIPYAWTDEMFEGLVEDEDIEFTEKNKCWYDLISQNDPTTFVLPDGYIFKNENGGLIEATKITLEKKIKEYPKNYEECFEVMYGKTSPYSKTVIIKNNGYKGDVFTILQKLIFYRDAYWKLYGEEMNLGKPWEPEDENTFSIFYDRLADEISRQDGYNGANSTFEFPMAEIRDQFHDNFGPDLEKIKKIL